MRDLAADAELSSRFPYMSYADRIAFQQVQALARIADALEKLAGASDTSTASARALHRRWMEIIQPDPDNPVDWVNQTKPRPCTCHIPPVNPLPGELDAHFRDCEYRVWYTLRTNAGLSTAP